MSRPDAVVSSCFVGHAGGSRRAAMLDMCLTSACTLRQHLAQPPFNSSMRLPVFHYLVEQSCSAAEVARFKAYADIVSTLSLIHI